MVSYLPTSTHLRNTNWGASEPKLNLCIRLRLSVSVSECSVKTKVYAVSNKTLKLVIICIDLGDGCQRDRD